MIRNKIKSFLAISSVYLLVTGCNESHNEWAFEKIIKLDGINPLGIVVEDDFMWLTDVDRNRMVKTDLNGNLIKSFPGLMRPMHIALNEGKFFIPEFLRDTITIIEGKNSVAMPLNVELDAPAGIDLNGNTKAIVDFYNHRVILINEGKTTIIGKEGHAGGELNYPTDIALYEDEIFVADAYNNRIQVFSYNGRLLKIVGSKDDIKVATGLAVRTDRIYVTDFNGNRVLIYDFDGTLLNILKKHFDKPTDIFICHDRLYAANYGGGSVTVFNLP